jgi:hypothetical protein
MAKSAFWLLCGGLLVLTAVGVVRAQPEAGPATPLASPASMGAATPLAPALQVTPAGIAARVGGQQAAAQATIAAYATREAQQAAEIARLQGLVADTQVTVTALAVVAANTVLDPTPRSVTIQTDLNGMLGEDPGTLSAARTELGRQLSRYPLGCRAGFMLVSGKAPDVPTGVALAQAVDDLLRASWPDIFDDSTGEAVFALPGEEPFGEVEIEVFFYSGCEPIE